MALTVRQVADLVGAEVRGDGSREVRGVSPLDSAGPGDLAFAGEERLGTLANSEAAAVIVPRRSADRLGPSRAVLLLAEDPRLAFARALKLFVRGPRPAPGIDPRAHVGPGAEVDPSAHVGPFAFVGERARVGPRAVIHAGAWLGDEAELGEDSVLFPGVVVYPRSRIERRVVVHAGAVIGSDGYGYVWDGQRHVKVDQVGIAVVEDDVEIGAGCTIDRGALGETRIGRGSKLDNLVHVGHNVRVGEHCLLVAQVGVAGSTRLGNHVVLGGQVGVGGHLHLADGVRVGGQAGVAKSLEAPGDYWGTPAREHRTWLRMLAALSRLPRLLETVRDLEARLAVLERARRD
jgi:UDP-3-O-[3-hydroxymyristoyl] glucosamine N-acyltransferase